MRCSVECELTRRYCDMHGKADGRLHEKAKEADARAAHLKVRGQSSGSSWPPNLEVPRPKGKVGEVSYTSRILFQSILKAKDVRGKSRALVPGKAGEASTREESKGGMS